MPAVQGPEFCPQHFKINEPGEAEICRGAGDLAKVTPRSVSGEGSQELWNPVEKYQSEVSLLEDTWEFYQERIRAQVSRIPSSDKLGLGGLLM